MKNKEVIKKLEQHGFWLKGHGGNHDKYTNGKVTVPIPRHKEIKDRMAKIIFEEAGITDDDRR